MKKPKPRWMEPIVTDPDEEDFATLFEQSQQARQFERGQTVDGRIVAIGPEVAFVDVGGKGEAVVELDELRNEGGQVDVAVGDRIQAVVVSTGGGLVLSRKLTRGAATDRQLAGAYDAGLPVEGRVESVLKGGYEVRIGRQRAFCPFSQIDIVRTADPAVHVGRTYTFRIIEFKNDGRDLVVSRRALLEEEQRANADAVRRTVVPGAVLKGRVVSVRDFGAFIDLGGGVQGLLHVSDMGWSRVADTAAIVTPGEELTIKVLRVDEATGKIALGLKQLTDDPWSTVGATLDVGQVRIGRVTRVAEFGAFVEIEPGIEGLAHASSFPPTGRADAWKRLVPVGMVGPFEILAVDLEKRRIALALVDEASSRAAAAEGAATGIAPGARVTGKVERVEPFGVFLYLGPGRTALMPNSETGVPRDGDIARMFPVGSELQVVILEVDPSGRRIRASRKAVQEAEEAAQVREYRERTDADASGGVGTLADKLRGALESRDRR
jgi:small subunit ribosomal protein S1